MTLYKGSILLATCTGFVIKANATSIKMKQDFRDSYLIKYCFASHPQIFHSQLGVKLRLLLSIYGLWEVRDLYCVTLALPETSVYTFESKGLLRSVASYHEPRIMMTYSNRDTNGIICLFAWIAPIWEVWSILRSEKFIHVPILYFLFGGTAKNLSRETQQVWHDKDPLCSKVEGNYHRPKLFVSIMLCSLFLLKILC